MNIGDLVRERPQGIYLVEKLKRRIGVITDVDPLRKAIIEQGGHFDDMSKTVEIVILLTNGTQWFAAPSAWEVISEGR